MRRPTAILIRSSVALAGAFSAAFASAFASACAAPAAAPAPRPAAEAVAPAAADPLAAPWSVTATSGPITQEIRLEASLVSRVDSVERRDTIRAVVSAAWSRVHGDGAARLAGLLTGFRLSADSAEPLTPAGLRLPVPFSALDGVGALQARFTSPDPAGCGLDAAAASALREVFVTMPQLLTPGTRWRDSSSHVVCRDAIALSVQSAREFRVIGAERRDGHIVVLLERHSRTTMRGEGLQFGESITVEAQGEGEAQLAVRLAGGFVVAGSGESVLRMTMRGRRRSQELTQRTRIEILAP
jgi:hypothetical protein